MPPFADAMRFINRERRHVPRFQIIEKTRHQQALRRDVEQFEFAIVQTAQPPARFTCAQRRVEERGRHTRRRHRVHLVFHQRDQGRNDDGQTRANQRRELKTKRLSAARGQHRKYIAPLNRIADDLLLQRTERPEAEVLLQRSEELI